MFLQCLLYSRLLLSIVVSVVSKLSAPIVPSDDVSMKLLPICSSGGMYPTRSHYSYNVQFFAKTHCE